MIVFLQKKERPTATRQEMFAEKLSALPAISSLNLGPLFKSSQSVELTEAETESQEDEEEEYEDEYREDHKARVPWN